MDPSINSEIEYWKYSHENNHQSIRERKSAIHKVKAVLQQKQVSHKNTGMCQFHNGHQNTRVVVEIEALKDAPCALQRYGKLFYLTRKDQSVSTMSEILP